MSRKVWKSNEEATAGIELKDDELTISVGTAGGHANGIKADKTGTYLSGKMSILTSPEQIRVGGFWTQNSPFLMMFPSTIASPIPHLIFNPPLGGLVDMAEEVAWAISFLG